jgi:hypothetical protein
MGFMPDVKGLTAKLEERFQQLVAELRVIGDKLDTLIEQGKEKAKGEGGGIPLAFIIMGVVAFILIGGLFVSCDALFEDEDEVNDLGMPALILDHDRYGDEYDDGCWDGECGRERGDQRGGDGRGGYSGGPSGGYYEGGQGGDDYDGDGDGNRCRNFCVYPVQPPPGEGGQR